MSYYRRRQASAEKLESVFHETQSLFQKTNSSVHREALTDIAAPALTWHRSFLIPKRPENGEAERSRLASEEHLQDPPERRLSPDDVKEKLDEILEVFLKNLRDKKLDFRTMPYADEKIILFNRLLDAQTLFDVTLSPGRLRGLPKTPERSFVIDITWPGLSENECKGFDFLREQWNIAIRMQVLSNLFSITLIASPRAKNLVAINSPLDFYRWTHEIWLAISLYFDVEPIRLARRKERIFSALFADIRGVILPCDPLPPVAGKKFPAWGGDTARKLSPFVVTSERYECSATYLLDRRALHITALGPQPLGLSRRKRRPSTFITCVHTSDAADHEVVGKRQLGRLLDRLHFLGTMRLAALVDLPALEEASQALARIDEAKKEARNSIQLYEGAETEAKATRGAIELFRKQLYRISNHFLDQSSAGVGIMFRIESSRYYVSQFRENLKALRLSRVEGFQPYDRFVERRLGVTYASIDRLGIRYERAQKEMEGIDQSFASIQTRHTGQTVAEIQRDGEAILIGVLVPYYLIATLAHLLEAKEHREGLLAAWYGRLFGAEERTELLLFASIWTLCVISAATRWIYNRFFAKRYQVRTFFIWAAVFAIAEFLIFLLV